MSASSVVMEAEAGQGALHTPRQWTRSRRAFGYMALRVLVVLLFFAVWQVVADRGIVPQFFISSPADVLKRIGGWIADGSLGNHIVITLREALVGFAGGSIAGIAIGFLLGRVTVLNEVFAPLLHLVNTLPRIALAPLFILWFGIDEPSKMVLVFTIVIFIMIFNTYGGVQTVNNDYVVTARLLGANEWQLTTKVILPWCIPWIFVGLRLSLAWSLSGAVVGEFLAARAGIGYLIFFYAGILDNSGVLAGSLVLLLMALVFFLTISFVEARLLRWRPEGF